MKLGAMGDVAWGKVGAGALHYNVDGQQVVMKKNGGGEGERDERREDRNKSCIYMFFLFSDEWVSKA